MTKTETVVRNGLAAIARALPDRVRGRARAGQHLQDALTNYADDDESLVWVTLRDGSRLRIDLRSPTERTAFWTGSYDSETISAITGFLRPGDNVIDVGANIGFYTVPMGRRLREIGGALYAIEPFAPNLERLRENLAANDLLDTVSVIASAVGDRGGSVTLVPEPGEARTANTVAHEAAPDAAGAVSLTTLDSIVEREGIRACRFMKIDVEGWELAALRGATGLLTTHRPVVEGELNAFWMQDRGWSYDDLAALAASCDYDSHRAGGEIGTFLLIPTESSADEVAELLRALAS